MKRNSITQTGLDFQIQETNGTLTSRSGLAIVQETAMALGIVRDIAEQLPQPGSNRGFAPEEYVMPLVLMFCGGGRAMEELREIKQDTGLRKLCNLDRIPSTDAFGTWLRNSQNLKGMKRVNEALVDQTLERTAQDDFTLDTDATYLETEKNCAKVNYKGEKSFSILLSFISNLDLCVRSDYRNGNISPATGIADHLKYTLRLLKRHNKRLKHFRSDSAAYNSEVINLCMAPENRVIFTITADKDSAVKAAIKKIEPHEWQRLRDRHGFDTGRQSATTIHTMEKTNNSYTLIVQRWPNPAYDLFTAAGVADERKKTSRTEVDGVPAPEAKPPEPFCYHAIATNDNDRTPKELIEFHNQRGDAENYNKEIKNGFGMDYAPSRKLAANAVWFEIGKLTYNLMIAFKRLLLEPTWWRKTIATLRWELLSIPGKVVWHGRQLYLRVVPRHCELLRKIRDTLRAVLLPT
jgi:hypothetical protein